MPACISTRLVDKCTVNLYLKCQRNQKKKKERGVEEVTINCCYVDPVTNKSGSVWPCLSFTAGYAHTYADALINNAHFPHIFHIFFLNYAPLSQRL